MAKRKDTPNPPGEQITQHILSNYNLKDTQDIQNVMKQILRPIFESMLIGELENHLGDEKHERIASCGNTCNGYSAKALKISLGELPIHFSRAHQDPFRPQVVKKHQKDVSSIKSKVLAMFTLESRGRLSPLFRPNFSSIAAS